MSYKFVNVKRNEQKELIKTKKSSKEYFFILILFLLFQDLNSLYQ